MTRTVAGDPGVARASLSGVRIIILDRPEAVALRAAHMVAERVRSDPRAVLALPTGATPVAMYAELARCHREQGLDFSRVTAFGVDEYVGLEPGDPHSMRAQLRRDFLDQVNLPSERSHALDAMVSFRRENS